MVTEFSGQINLLGDAARELALAGAEAGILEIHRNLISIVDDEVPEGGVLVQDKQHAGAPARVIDANAQEAVSTALQKRFEDLKTVRPNEFRALRVLGEEAGTQTQVLRDGTILARTDPLDGTTNAVNTLTGFSVVVCIDLVKRAGQPARHLAGAIFGGDFDLCWRNDTIVSRTETAGYARIAGDVYIRSARLGRGWQLLRVEQELRSDSVASVAASQRRFTAFEAVRERVFRHNGVVYHLAGNPLWAGLLMGQVGSVVETQPVTLHDSAFLIPHVLLGGKVEDAAGQPLDYLALYEQQCTSFDPKETPVPPYVAYGGGVNPLSDLTDLPVSAGPTAPSVDENLPLPANRAQRMVELPDDILE
jgi:hypothetical protein